MSRVGRCIDNGPMEGFWGILKRECYYGHTFSRESLFSTIENYIDYYNNRRYQHRLFIQTPMQAHVSAMNRGGLITICTQNRRFLMKTAKKILYYFFYLLDGVHLIPLQKPRGLIRF
mgnify:CR=1 FL=1